MEWISDLGCLRRVGVSGHLQRENDLFSLFSLPHSLSLTNSKGVLETYTIRASMGPEQVIDKHSISLNTGIGKKFHYVLIVFCHPIVPVIGPLYLRHVSR